MTIVADEPAARQRAVAGRFTEVARRVTDWDAPSPVHGWAARDVVGHLVAWLPGFLSAVAGIELNHGPDADADPVAAFEAQAAAVQAILDDPDAAATVFDNPHTGQLALPLALDRFYTSDVFLHTWDLAVATGQDASLDEAFCAELFEGMRPMDAVLRSSGQYGPAVAVPGDAPAQDRLLGFIGRDPTWTPPRA